MCRETTFSETGDFVSDEFLLERLAAFVEKVDPVPQSELAAARATFRSAGALSQPGSAHGAGSEPGLADLAELFGPMGQIGLRP